MTKAAAAKEKLIVALDVATRAEAISLALALSPFASWMKIGLQLFTAEGPDVVRAVQETGAKIFLDLKLHDIPNTVARAVESVARLNVQMLTVHLSGGTEMLRASAAAAPASLRLLGVTALTSMNRDTLSEIGIKSDVPEHVARLAKLASVCRIGGLITSAHETSQVRRIVGPEMKLVVPGIRPDGGDLHDQKRTATPSAALKAGADYLVIGRPIVAAAEPAAAAEKILASF